MADYDVGGRNVIEGGPAFPDTSTMGRHELAGWSLGSEIFLGTLGEGSESSILDAIRAAGAYADAHTTPTGAYFFLTGQGPDGPVYFGLQAYYATIYGPAGGEFWGCTSLSIISSDREDLSGDFTLIGALSPTWNDNYGESGWFQCYYETVVEQGTEVKYPYIGWGGRRSYESAELSYGECLSNIAQNPDDFATRGELPLKSPAGEWILRETAPDDSEPGGGYGDWDNDSDIIPWPDLPTLGAVASGFLTVYNPSALEMQRFGDYLWSSAWDIWDNIAKYQSNMLDLIVSFAVVPVAPPIDDQIQLKIGGKEVTDVFMSPVTSQYMSLDCGTFDLNEYYGSALDYGPYTKIQIYLPAIGYRELKTDEVMDGSVSVRYNIDLVNGSCVALVRCNRHGLNAVLYQFEGNISMQIPIVSRDFISMYRSITGMADAGATLATGSGNVAAGSGLATAALNVMTMKPTINRAGSLSANGSFLSVHKPYLIIERPIQSYPKDANKFYGYPCNQTYTLGSLRGYTECEAEILDISCTVEEMNEIRRVLREGVIL